MTITTTGVSKLGTGPDSVGLREFTVGDPGPGEVLLEVISAGICGTDLHIADDEFPSSPPVTMGHEVTGEVRSVGDDVDPGLVGGRFAAETYFEYCDTCSFCRTGSPNLCAHRRSFGSHVDGGFAQWLILPARNLHELPAHVARHAGSLAEPLACVANCLFDPPVVNSGDRVLVMGPGTMGVLAAQAARAAGGVVTVAGLAVDGRRLGIASGLGLATLTVGEDTISNESFDIVCECSGAEPAAEAGLAAVRRGGRYVHVGIFGHPVTLDLDLILYKEITYTSGFASTPQSWTRAMSLLDSGAVELDPLVSEVVPIAQWRRAFDATRAGAGMKFVIDPRPEGK